MADRVGQQIGNYRLIRRLGYGGFAEVYLGQHIYLEKFAAIKILHAQLAAADMESFRQEARTIANLEHPHIVRILEFGIQDATPYLVMDYAPNGSLRERHTRGSAVPLPMIVSYVNQVASALQYAHERNLIHRDVKPENILIGQNNTLLLSDFGIALIAQSSRSQSMQDVVGSVAYMAPEQLQGRPRFASDQYSLGITVYEWLCGDRPFHGSFTEIGSQHIFTPPPSLREKIPTLSPAIEEVVMVALAKDHQKRFATVQAFANAFEHACRSQASLPPIVVSPPVIGSSSVSLPPTVAGTPSVSLPPTMAGAPSASLPPGAVAPTSSISQGAGPSTPYTTSQTDIPTYQHPNQGATPPVSQQIAPTIPYGQQVSPTIPGGQPPGSFIPGTMPAAGSRKRPNVGLLLGTAVLVVALIAGGFFIFSKGNAGNQGTSRLTPGASSTSSIGSRGTAPVTGRASATAAVTPMTVALVIDVGGINDGGYNQMAYIGYEKARQQYGFPDVIMQPTTVSNNEYETKLTGAAQRADLVIGVGFNMEAALAKVAQQFPAKKFAIVDGCAADANFNCVNMSNVAPLFFKEQEAGCLVGALAGKMELDGKSQVPKLLGNNTIAAIGGLAIPAVNRYIAGYKYCAQKVDPSINVIVSYSNSFTNSTACSTIASNLITTHQADILFQVAGVCGIGVLDAATQHGVYSIGVDADQSKDANGATRPSVITSAIKRVDVAVFDIIQIAQMGTFSSFASNPFTFDVAHDGVGYAPVSSNVPQDAVQTAINFASEIKSGTLIPPTAIPS